MANWKECVAKLQNAGPAYARLDRQFYEFAQLVCRQVNDADFFLKGFHCEQTAGDGTFKLTFAGRELLFVFAARSTDTSVMQGTVTAYLSQRYPEAKQVHLNSFTFDARGQTNVTDEGNDNDLVFMNNDTGSLCLVADSVVKSLSRQI